MFKIATCCSRPEPCVWRGCVMPLDGCDVRILEVAKHLSEPVVPQHDVLIDLTDDWMGGLMYPGVDRRRRAPLAAVDQPQHAFALQLRQQPCRAVDAAVIDRDDLEWPAVA